MNSPYYIPRANRNRKGFRSWLRIGLVPLILVVVAAVHMFQWAHTDRSSWGTGCGFGMFATVDYHGTRFTKCWREVKGHWEPCEVASKFDQEEFLARIHPIDRNLRKLAVRLFESNVDKKTARTRSVRVEVWGMNLDGKERKLSSHLLNRVTIKQSTSLESFHVAKN